MVAVYPPEEAKFVASTVGLLRQNTVVRLREIFDCNFESNW
jgi:hypothetical protein